MPNRILPTVNSRAPFGFPLELRIDRSSIMRTHSEPRDRDPDNWVANDAVLRMAHTLLPEFDSNSHSASSNIAHKSAHYVYNRHPIRVSSKEMHRHVRLRIRLCTQIGIATGIIIIIVIDFIVYRHAKNITMLCVSCRLYGTKCMVDWAMCFVCLLSVRVCVHFAGLRFDHVPKVLGFRANRTNLMMRCTILTIWFRLLALIDLFLSLSVLLSCSECWDYHST